MPDIFVSNSKKKQSVEKGKTDSKNIENPDLTKKDITPPPTNHIHFFTAFHKNPDGIHFINQEANERILLFVRKAFITNIRWIVISVVLLAIPTIISPFTSLLEPIAFFPVRYILFFTLFYYLLVFSYIYVNFITWYFNISLVTNIRVIDIDFSNLIYKNLAATKLSLVQDVNFTQVGTLPTFFDYGDVLVQTAGTMDNFDFEAIPQPANAVHIVEDLIGKNGGV